MNATNTSKGKNPRWPMVRLGDVCDDTKDRVPSSTVALEDYVTTDNMLKNCAGICTAKAVPAIGSLVEYKKGDVLVSNIRPYLKKSWLADRNGGCSSDVIVFRVREKNLLPKYLFSALSSDSFFDYDMQNVSGTKMPRGKRDWILAYTFPLPPLDEQRAIVARLEKELHKADEHGEKAKRLAELAEGLFKAELDAAFKNVKGEKVRLGDVCEVLDAKRMPITKKDRVAGKIPYYGATGIVDFVKGWLFDERLVLLGEDGAKWGPHENSAFIIEGKVWVNNHAHVLRPCHGVYDCFLVYYLNHSDLNNYITGVTVPKLNQERMLSIVVPLLPWKIQREIVARLDAAKERADRLKEAATRLAALAGELRKATLAEAFA